VTLKNSSLGSSSTSCAQALQPSKSALYNPIEMQIYNFLRSHLYATSCDIKECGSEMSVSF